MAMEARRTGQDRVVLHYTKWWETTRATATNREEANATQMKRKEKEIGRRGGRRLLNLGEIQAERLEATEIRD